MTTSFSRGISRWRFFRLCWRAPVILITCAGILTRNVEPFSQAQLDLFSSEITLSSAILGNFLGNFIRRSIQLLIIQMITFNSLNVRWRIEVISAIKAAENGSGRWKKNFDYRGRTRRS